MVVYDENVLNEYSDKIRKGLWLCLLPFGFSLLFSIGLCFFLNEDKSNANLLHFLIVVVNTLIGWFSLSVLLGYVLPKAKRKRFIHSVMVAVEKEVCGTVTSMDNNLTVQEGIRVLEIRINCGGKVFSFYFDTEVNEPQFNVGDILKMIIARNFVSAYEVVGHEEEK